MYSRPVKQGLSELQALPATASGFPQMDWRLTTDADLMRSEGKA
jgi:hypothetical protein